MNVPEWITDAWRDEPGRLADFLISEGFSWSEIANIIPKRSIEERVAALRCVLSQADIGVCVQRSQAWVSRLDPTVYARHLEYNAEWKRRRRAELKQSPPPSAAH